MQPIDPEAAILPLSLRLLGPFQALLDGRPFSLRHSRKEQWLLALLTLRHNRDVERDWLAGTLWPESQKSRTLLRDTLSDLRQALGSQAGRLCSPTAHTLCLELTGADVDVLAFDAAIARGDQASLEEAVGLYRGPLLEGCTEEWALAERAAREQAYVQALERLAQQALSQANAASAVGYLQRVVLMDPLRESAQRALMQALAAAGDHAAAVLAYRDLRLLLRRELHADPDPETTALFQRIRQEARLRAHRSQLEMPSTISSASRQVSEESATQALASGTPETRPNNLPIPVTSFIGREAERETIQQLLSASRLVTLTGAGGCGKTRLALRVAADVLQSDTAYPDGVWLGELASLSDAALAPQRVSEALGLSDKPDQSFQETLLDHLKPRQLLLLLDNCEHLLSACAPLAGEILQHCAGVRILATSRQALGIQGESLYQVPSLRQPDPRDLPQDKKEIVAAVAGYDAVRLFVERASAQRSDFALTEQNARAVAEVCHRLDGIPLAIELAAARIGALTPAQIAARLDDRFGLLTGGSRTALPRQQTLKATLDWSYHLLSDPERILLRRLCVFSGGWTLEAAEQVCAGDGIASGEVLDLLSSLVDKSLVGFEVGMRGEGRYHLLETLRQYSRERLKERQEEKALRNRHLEFFLALAEDAERRHIEEDLAGWLETEHDNLRLALAWCKQEGEIEYRLRLSGSLWWFWWMRGYAGEGRATLTEALAHAEASGRTGVRAKALRAAGVLAGIQGDHEAARALLEESLTISQELEDKPGIAHALHWLGHLARHHRDNTVARARYEQSLKLYQEVDDRPGIAASFTCLGLVAYFDGDYDRATELHKQGLDMKRKMGDRRGIAFSLNDLSDVVRGRGDHEAARALLEESLTIYQELEDKPGMAYALSKLGDVVRYQQNYEAARTLIEQGLALFQEVGDRSGIAYALYGLGKVARDQGNDAAARTQLVESLTLFGELGETLGAFCTPVAIAALVMAQGQAEDAARLLGAAETLREAIGAPPPREVQDTYVHILAATQQALGEGAFAAARAEGRRIASDQAAMDALARADLV